MGLLLLVAALAAFGALDVATPPPARPPEAPAREAPVGSATVAHAWPEWKTSVEVRDRSLLEPLQQALARAERQAGTPDPSFAYWLLQIRRRDGTVGRYRISRDLDLFEGGESGQGAFVRHPDLGPILQRLTRELDRRTFGHLLMWRDPRLAENPDLADALGAGGPGALTVERLWPRGADARVEDLDSGRHLQVRRSGGAFHADVEPLTPQDTATLREIFGGRWSWKRRAVVVMVAGMRVAASMNGMPHGRGAIPDNEFDGHFCLHFAGSRLHRTGEPDRGHQLMVRKAAGSLADFLDRAPPEELAMWVLVGVANRDLPTVRYATYGFDAGTWQRVVEALGHVAVGPPEPAARPGVVEIETVVYPGPSAGEALGFRRRVALQVTRPAGARGYRVDFGSLRSLVDPPAGPSTRVPPEPGC